MLGVQVPRSLPDPAFARSSRGFDTRVPPSRDRLGLRSLHRPSRTPPSRAENSGIQHKEVAGADEMTGSYGAVQPPPAHYSSGTYGAAMSGISSQRSGVHTSSNWSSLHSSGGHQGSQSSVSASQAQSRAASPEFETQPSYGSDGYAQAKSSSNNAIHPYLQLPPTISPTGGSISEFAAQTTCLFWFESSSTLSRIENTSHQSPARSLMVPDARPTTGFLKWVTTILSTTQVTQNVIILALLFIHRLKKQNPTVKGKLGSEYRLLTVALMLGNKFLDDNTYTNKTWAEVSGISVTEIHVMEVEFLSHMKYNLYTSKEEWLDWHKQLAHLWRFFNAASPRIMNVQPRYPPSSTKPAMLQIPRSLPSPPSSNNASSPPHQMQISPSYPSYSTAPTLPQPIPSHQISPASSIPPFDYPFGRKRSYDESAQSVEPPPKRQYTYDAHQATRSSTPVQVVPPQSSASSLGTLPIPHLPHPGQQLPRSTSFQPSSTPSSHTLTPTHTLPPAHNWQPGSSQSFDNRSLPALHVATGGHLDRSRQQTPYDGVSRHSSPLAPHYHSAAAAAHTTVPNQLSPSMFLHQRSSPYRPVRNISTLLVPPASGQLRNHPQQLPNEQMYYQPLGRQSVMRSGRVPYDDHGAWPEHHQYQHWPASYHHSRS